MSEIICPVCGGVHARDAPCESAVDSRLGGILDGKYEIIRILGAGGMGKVYEARHVRIGRRFAIKFLLPQYAAHPQILKRFENEARAAGTLVHENIAAVQDFGQAPDGSSYIVMDFLSGEDCEKLLGREGPLPVARAVKIALQVCRGLQAAHQAGIVHRDLKPANLFLTQRADRTDLVKILDFGIAKVRSDAGASTAGTASGVALGTAYYMSPEQARGEKTVDNRTDVYALGVILYELLSGKKPFQGDSVLQIIFSILNRPPPPLESLCTRLPVGLPAVVARAMRFGADERYATVEDLGEALIPFAQGQVAPFRPQVVGVYPAQISATLASDGEVQMTAQGLSTTAPVSPMTRGEGAALTKARRRNSMLAAAGLLALGAVAVVTLRSRSKPDGDAAFHAASSVAAATNSPMPPVAPSASPSSVSGHDDRPDTGAAAVPSGGLDGVVGSGLRTAPALRRGESKTKSAVSPTATPGPSAAPPTAPRPARTTIDIDREPNF
jgi:serine/threonine protein kinase